MNYYTITFSYRGPTCNCPDDFNNAPDKALIAADEAAELFLSAAGVDFQHCYCYPDGTLIKYVRSEMERVELGNYLKRTEQTTPLGEELFGYYIDEVESTKNPYKFRTDSVTKELTEVLTLEDLFEDTV